MKARGRRGVIVSLLAYLTLIACGGPPPNATRQPSERTSQPSEPPGKILLGVYYGNQGWKMDQVKDMESWLGKKHAVVVLFTNWCDRPEDMDNLFTQQLPNIWDNHNVPLITWEPFLCSPGQTPADVEVRAAAGEYDDYFKAWADRLKLFVSGPDEVYNTADDRRAYLRMGHEMNGNWYPWSAAMGSNSPSDFVDMWKHVRGIFDATGLDETRLQWVWAVNNDDVGGFRAEQYYPGDEYVDWLGLDGFNFGESQSWSDWRSPSNTYNAMLTRLGNLASKPVALPEFGSSASTAEGTGVDAKLRWITELFDLVIAKDIRMVAWFNEDKETDWAILGGSNGDETYVAGPTTYKVYSAYKTAVTSSLFLAADPEEPHLLTDAQFAGQ